MKRASPEVLEAIDAGLALLPGAMDSRPARVILYAIGYQESEFKHRVQVAPGGGRGPARGWWQFERGGGCAGTIRHPASRYWAKIVCDERGIPFNAEAVHAALEFDDVAAAAFARLFLFTDPHRLPLHEEPAWRCYLRVWRPGKPRPKHWAAAWAAALEAYPAA